MSQVKPRLLQVLCGPETRHAIFGLPYAPGVTAAQDDAGDITLTPENIADYARRMVDGMIQRGTLNPWCHMCGRKRDGWAFEDNPLRFNTLEEALPFLFGEEQKQMEVRRIVNKGRDVHGRN